MSGLVMTGADRRPFSLLAWFANERSCIMISNNDRENYPIISVSLP